MNFQVGKKAFYFLIILNYLVDVFNGVGAHFLPILSMSGTVVRGGLTIFGLMCIEDKKILHMFCFVLSLFFLYYILNSFRGLEFNYNIEFSQFVKILFPFSIASILYKYCRVSILTDNDFLVGFSLAGMLLSLGIIGSVLVGVSVETYTEGSFGQKGIILNQNDASLILAISILTSFYGALRYSLKYTVTLLPCIVASVIIGTRMGIIASILFPVISYYMFLRNSDVGITKKILYSPLLLSGGGVLLFYIIQLVSKDNYLINKFIMMIEGGSPRGRLYEIGEEIVLSSSVTDLILGKTASKFYATVQDAGMFFSFHSWGKRVEVDPLDMVGCYGMVIYFMLLYYYFWKPFRVIYKCSTQHNSNINLMLIVIIGYLFLHSLFLGHVITQPIAGMILGVVMYYSIELGDINSYVN